MDRFAVAGGRCVGTSPPATAVADPADDAPDVRSGSRLRVTLATACRAVGDAAELRRRVPDDDGAGGTEPDVDGVVVDDVVPCVRHGGVRGQHALGVLEVLDEQGHVGEQAGIFTRLDPVIDVLGLAARGLGVAGRRWR